MKLSDMFANLARGAQDLEARAAQWERDWNTKSDELQNSAKTWLADAQKRDQELKAKAAAYFNDASDQVKAEWTKAQSDWDSEVARLRARADDARKKAETMQANETADWYEAYAAQAVAFAQRVQEEASNAVAAAAKARADAAKKD